MIAIIDDNRPQVVEYTYDAWGKPLTRTDTLAATFGTLNPFRYRGYVYDEETGLYYLRSRYYNPEWGRFISTDIKIIGKGCLLNVNVYSYCRNSPLQFIDDSGKDISYETKYAITDHTYINLHNQLVITVDVFLQRLEKFTHRNYSYRKFQCASYIAENLVKGQSATGATTIFKEYTVTMGYISDIGGKEGLIPGMLVGIYDEDDNDGFPYNHIGVFAGTTVVDGQTKYRVYESTPNKGPHLAEFDDQKWNVWGWHTGVILDDSQYSKWYKILWLVHEE